MYDYQLKLNDVIKMGRVKLKVSKIVGRAKVRKRTVKQRRRIKRVKEAITEKIKEIEGMTGLVLEANESFR